MDRAELKRELYGHLEKMRRQAECTMMSSTIECVYRAFCTLEALSAAPAPAAEPRRVTTEAHVLAARLAVAEAERSATGWHNHKDVAEIERLQVELAVVTVERDTLRIALDESTTDLVVTGDNILCEVRRGQKQWEGVYEHLRDRIDANRKIVPLSAALTPESQES